MGWYEPDGTRKGKAFGPGARGKKLADKYRKQVEAELMTGTYQMQTQKTCEEFRVEYETRVLPGLDHATQIITRTALNHFERIVKPVRVFALSTPHVDKYVAARREERGKKKGTLVSPATINKELRHLKAVFNVAAAWGYTAYVPKFHMVEEPQKLPTYVTGDHFAAIYKACDVAKLPKLPNFNPADWWRGLMVMGYMTGWRISDMLGLRREDLDLEAGTAITRAEDNKAGRDEKVKLHPVVVDHLKQLAGFDPNIFPWNRNSRVLGEEFAKIQEAAGIHLPCRIRDEHEHTRFCHTYGFHDLRRAFASMNADKLTADALQVLMRHKSYETAKRYINMAQQMDEAVASLHVPDVLKRGVTG